MSTKNRTAEQQPQHPLSLTVVEQINIALEQKGPGISQPGSLKPAVGITSERGIYIN